jgi:leader peptidase (prepilin peptidase) / N-methyltransferase
LSLLPGLVLLTTLLAAAIIDWRSGLIPRRLSLFLAVSGLGFSLLNGWEGAYRAVCGGAVGAGLLWSMGLLGRWLLKRPSMGGGDVRLAAGMGLYLGWAGMLHVLLLSCFLGAGLGLALRLVGRLSPYTPVPFVPFLFVATAIDILLPEWRLWMEFVG